MSFCKNCPPDKKKIESYNYYGEYSEEVFYCRECNKREKIYYDNQIKLNEIYTNIFSETKTSQAT